MLDEIAHCFLSPQAHAVWLPPGWTYGQNSRLVSGWSMGGTLGFCLACTWQRFFGWSGIEVGRTRLRTCRAMLAGSAERVAIV